MHALKCIINSLVFPYSLMSILRDIVCIHRDIVILPCTLVIHPYSLMLHICYLVCYPCYLMGHVIVSNRDVPFSGVLPWNLGGAHTSTKIIFKKRGGAVMAISARNVVGAMLKVA